VSCGNPHDTPCAEALELLSAYLDGEMTEADHVRLRQHYDECPPCFDELGVYEVIKLKIQHACACESAPEQLRASVVAQIHTLTVQWRSGS
jgi:anti-sigma factor (TIGR02949 family)